MKSKNINRRNFLKKTSISALGAGMVSQLSYASSPEKQNQEEIKIKEYRTFGNTGFKVSDISSGNPSNETILKTLLKSGVNLIDTGETYGNGNSERLIGKVIKDFDRNSIFINSKIYSEKQFPSKEDVINRINNCLERLETDYVDCMQIHSVENVSQLKDEAFHSAMEQLKKEGKVRHIGISCHGNSWAYNTKDDYGTILREAINDGRFEVILLAYNFVNKDIVDDILDICEQKNIATLIMKSNPVYIFNLMDQRVTTLKEKGKEPDEFTKAFYDKYKVMQDDALSFFEKYEIKEEKELMEAASKFVLSNPKANTTLWDFRNFDDVQKMLALSGQRLSENEASILDGYNKQFNHLSCRIGCNKCEAACPHHLEINKILRFNYYFTAKRQEKRAIAEFANLKSRKPSDACLDCEGYCEDACPYGVTTRSLLATADQNMTLTV